MVFYEVGFELSVNILSNPRKNKVLLICLQNKIIINIKLKPQKEEKESNNE
jgi:hypothetical protein